MTDDPHDTHRRRGEPDDLAEHTTDRTRADATSRPSGSSGSAQAAYRIRLQRAERWARCRARATSARRSASPTSWPWPTPTSCGTGPRTRTGRTATGSCSRSATTRSRCTRRWPRPGSSRSRSWRPTAPTSPGCRCRGWPPTRPGMEISGGSLGHGLAVATGMALGLRHQGNPARVFNLLSDGELDEGSTWEAALQVAHHGLDNVTAIVDVNALQADGPTAGMLRTEPVTDKWQAFGWNGAAGRRQRHRRARRRLRRAARAPRLTLGADLRHPDRARGAAAGDPREGPLHAGGRARVADRPRPARGGTGPMTTTDPRRTRRRRRRRSGSPPRR